MNAVHAFPYCFFDNDLILFSSLGVGPSNLSPFIVLRKKRPQNILIYKLWKSD